MPRFSYHHLEIAGSLGGVRMRALRVLTLGFFGLVAGALGWSAKADDLVIPYACEMDNGAPHLKPASATSYRIIGPKEDLSFTACGSSSDSCEMMMVHKFDIECAGHKVSWARVAASAPEVGVVLPAHLPDDFAPISRFKGRLVLPGFGRTTHLASVERRPLSADSVIETGAVDPGPRAPQWVTVVDPVRGIAGASGAFKVAGVISVLLISLMAGCFFVARRRTPWTFDFAGPAEPAEPDIEGSWTAGKRAYARTAGAFWRNYRNRSSKPEAVERDDTVSKTLAAVHARIVETELLIATLPPDLLLREVLQTELDGLRARAAGFARRSDQLDAKKTSAGLRSVLRDLDRMTRIVNGTVRQEDQQGSASLDPPATVFEAYRVLGLNSDAPPTAVKKVVDALRMSWHPDHARNDADRRQREERIKQVNAAWDLLKEAQAAA